MDNEGWRVSCAYQEGVKNGLGKDYYPDGSKGKVDKQETREDVGGWANYVGEWKGGKKNGLGTNFVKDRG